MMLHEQQCGAVTVLRPEGPMVVDDAEVFKQRASEQLRDTLGRCVIDCSQIPYVDSDGLEALLDVSEDLAHTGQALKLCGANETIRQVLTLTNLTDAFEHFSDVTSAVRSYL